MRPELEPEDFLNRIVPVAELEAWLPHRAPMVWIDDVVSASKDGGECRVKVKSAALYMSEGKPRPSSYIEFIAQAFGFTSARFARSCGESVLTPKKAFLVSVTRCELFSKVTSPKEVRVLISNVKPVGPIILFDGEVRDENESLLCKASLKVYSE
jgi:predicted hotdog family 3-hydroxylacyl-ACP dehydratase